MAKKATLLKRAQKLGLDVTEANKVPEIQAALDAHAAAQKPATPVEPETTSPEAPEAPQNNEVGSVTSVELEAPEREVITLKQVLLTYNSINRSRRRWVINRNQLRNTWKELFELLEKASGRDGGKAGVFDPNWHEVVEKGAVSGAADRAEDDIQVAVYESDADRKVADLEEKVASLTAQLEEALAKEKVENDSES
jgi:hypothetical protein